MLHSLHVQLFLGPAELCFLATWQYKSSLDLVEKLGHFGQHNVRPLQRGLCRDRLHFVTEVPQFPQVTLTFRSKAGIVGVF